MCSRQVVPGSSLHSDPGTGPSSQEPRVRAAGGLVTRDGLVLLVNQTGKGWGLPKGRLEPGEPAAAAALREVLEETGCACQLGERLPMLRYVDGNGRLKCVQFWRMDVLEERERLAPETEIAEIAWLNVAEATARVRHAHERSLLEALTAPSIATSPRKCE